MRWGRTVKNDRNFETSRQCDQIFFVYFATWVNFSVFGKILGFINELAKI